MVYYTSVATEAERAYVISLCNKKNMFNSSNSKFFSNLCIN